MNENSAISLKIDMPRMFFNFFFLKCNIRKVTGTFYFIFVPSSQLTLYLYKFHIYGKILPEIQIAIKTVQPNAQSCCNYPKTCLKI